MLIYQLEYFRQLISYRASTASEEAENGFPFSENRPLILSICSNAKKQFPYQRNELILQMNLLLLDARISYQFSAFQIFLIHIDRRNLMIVIRSIIIDSFVGITT